MQRSTQLIVGIFFVAITSGCAQKITSAGMDGNSTSGTSNANGSGTAQQEPNTTSEVDAIKKPRTNGLNPTQTGALREAGK